MNSDSSDPQWADKAPYLYQMSYCSVMRQHLSPQALDELVANAQRNNLAQGITGVLMIEKGLVIQWLEGNKSEVRRLWAKLLQDPRHHCMVELTHREFVTERLFPDWSMHRTTRQEMIEIVHSARELAAQGEETPWAGAIATLCVLIDPAYASAYHETMRSAEHAASMRSEATQ